MLCTAVLFLTYAYSSVLRAESFSESLPEPLPQDVASFSETDLPTLFRQARWTDAATLLRTMIRKNPERLERSLDLVRVLLFMGQRSEAIDLLTEAMSRMSPNERKKAWPLESAVWNQFIKGDALQKYERGLEPLYQGRWEIAAPFFEEAMNLEPLNVRPAIRYAQAKIEQGEAEAGVRALEPLLNRGRDHPEPDIAFWLGKGLLKEKRAQEALRFFRMVPSDLNEELPLLMADALVHEGAFDEAVTVLSKDIERFPAHVLSLLKRSELRVRQVPERRLSSNAYWEARRDVQLAMSRIELFEKQHSSILRSEWGLQTLDASGVRTELEARLQLLKTVPQ